MEKSMIFSNSFMFMKEDISRNKKEIELQTKIINKQIKK